MPIHRHVRTPEPAHARPRATTPPAAPRGAYRRPSGAEHRNRRDIGTVEPWIAELVEHGYSATVVIRAYGVLAGVLDSAVKERRRRLWAKCGHQHVPATRKAPYLAIQVGRCGGGGGI
ncbi:hypothetical protein C5E45_00265 [Nocardia nova]|uniref:Uncharacterized protein n=1 Tax=Nocardia nova TaxID=37330 RepID=A0A2S6AWM0_9NOCA|nr:hypothetical protein C5E41_13480 [Nocardia nova]PPJ39646.1 hypothetical protein C5E45_00265 [Nocardia nova]